MALVVENPGSSSSFLGLRDIPVNSMNHGKGTVNLEPATVTTASHSQLPDAGRPAPLVSQSVVWFCNSFLGAQSALPNLLTIPSYLVRNLLPTGVDSVICKGTLTHTIGNP